MKGNSCGQLPAQDHSSSLWTKTKQDGFPASPSVVTISLSVRERTIWDFKDSGPSGHNGKKRPWKPSSVSITCHPTEGVPTCRETLGASP